MILVDVSEPDTIVNLLKQAIPTTKAPLNQNKIADYFFGNYEGKRVQFGRAQVGEVLSDIDSVEDEFKRYYDNADETNQITEGIMSPIPLAALTNNQISAIKSGKISWNEIRYEPKIRLPAIPSTRFTSPKLISFSYKVESITDKNGVTVATLTSGRGHDIPISAYYAWIYGLQRVGIHTFHTNNWEETARFLITVYKNEQKPPEAHSTFQRIYRPKVHIKKEKDMTKEELETHKLTKALLFLSSAYNLGIGEVRAKALAERFCNIMDISLASLSELTATEGIGRAMAEKLQRSLGRDI